ncbi:MAG: AzlD domain-containing protein [Clostridia bacterium]|nr:AzlD domain-containing protein [Clostridia bacterium]
MKVNVIIAILLMAGITYLIRVLPLVLIRREIKNPIIRSFLYYVPYVTLSVMTFPAILSATGSVLAGAVALVASAVLALMGCKLPLVATVSCVAVFLVGLIPL